jgi:ribosomal protein S18 acetylase RimI-like enzyme
MIFFSEPVAGGGNGFAVGQYRAIQDVARENVELVQLSVVKENGAARRLYDSLGFLEFGMEPKASKVARRMG